MGNLIGSLKIAGIDFVVSTPHSNSQFLIIGNFGEATIVSNESGNDHICHLCKVGSISLSLRSSTDLITCESELCKAGSCPMLSHMGTATVLGPFPIHAVAPIMLTRKLNLLQAVEISDAIHSLFL